MGTTTADADTDTAAVRGDSESAALLLSPNQVKIPRDTFHLAYIIYFTLGAGYLLPWNAFITAVDYFSFLYPDASVDRVFAVVYVETEKLNITHKNTKCILTDIHEKR
ncbi:hypothetical protein SASPL_107640 [Salvia splendens]|uniref:Uncharacterized protein n=1 Tax=Salvia splendens TaxID=180675 RepID=A0A8X8YH83_SALSN|nr:hypothetical protein SASPL_107640 [Salvia splendens]